MRELFVKALKTVGVAILLFLVLFTGALRGPFLGVIATRLREAGVILMEPESQWMAFLCLGVYFTALIFFRYRASSGFWRAANPHLWLACALVIIAALYASDYTPSVQALTFIAGAALGQGMAFWTELEFHNSKFTIQNSLVLLVVSILVLLLACVSVLHVGAARTYEYHSRARWAGVWDNPNIFGVLMGTGVLLALGLTMASFYLLSGKIGRWLCAPLCLLAAILMGRGLMHSYSRGAWLATVCGGTYFLWHWINREIRGIRESEQSPPGPASADPLPSDEKGQSEGISCISRFKRNWLPFAAILGSTFVLVFWHFRGTDWHPARRAFSSVNAVDFSCRNRIAAWEGTWQIIAEHPFLGAGWNQPEPLYEHYYLSPKLSEPGAFELNDYLLFGATLGIPALFCFGMYVWLSLRRKGESRKQKAEINDMEWWHIVCHAGAIVLLVGFWFDGGLFKLPTAATFWILLELGSVQDREPHELREHE